MTHDECWSHVPRLCYKPKTESDDIMPLPLSVFLVQNSDLTNAQTT